MQNKPQFKILVVDDETKVCESIKILLLRKGFDVYTANSVKESIKISEEILFDLFLIDKNLSGDDGFALMDYLLQKHPDIPFIMMTGNASIDSAVLALRKGAYDYLRKPFKYEELVNIVSRALAQKQLKDENKVINERLNESERRYKEMIHNSPDLIVMLDVQGNIRFVNNTFVSMLGYSFDNIKGIPFIDIVDERYIGIVLSFLGFSLPESGAISDRQVEERLTTSSPFNDVECASGIDIEILCSPDCASDRKTMDIEIRKSHLSFYQSPYNCSAPEKEICIVGRDISFRKAFEKQMIYSQKMEAVALLAGSVAHDFNNLLMGIQGYTSVIKSSLDFDDPCYKKLLSIEKNIIKGSNLTSQLLNFAKGGASDIQFTNLNYVLKDTLELFSINKKGIKIHLDLASDLWGVKVDSCQMEQVFLNIFINAHHAMDNRGDIFIKTENVLLHEFEAKEIKMFPGSYVKISIRDTGHGIDEKYQKRIFDPFFSTKKKSEGTGLGLASAYGIIKKHNGTITVSSSSGKGALFTIYLCVNVERSCFELQSNLNKEYKTKTLIPMELKDGINLDKKKQLFKTNPPLYASVLDDIIAKKSVNSHNIDKKVPVETMAGAKTGTSINIADAACKELEVTHQNQILKMKLVNGRKMTALIIDDEPFVQEAAVSMLNNIGINTIIAGNGREGVQKYMENLDGIDLVVLDMVMPGMSGFETFKYIRKLNPEARILIASAYSHVNEISSMVAEGRCSFLKKTYDVSQFYDRIRELLGTQHDEIAGLAN